MRTKALGLFAVLSVLVSACGAPAGGGTGGVDGDEPVLQIISEGGFVPVEMSLNNGPRYTLLGDGRLIHQGFQTLQYPGPLLPPYLVARLDESQMNSVLAMVDRIGLPEITDEHDDSAASMVADAATDRITYWDAEGGEHSYSVYALGMGEDTSERNAAFLELVQTFDEFVAGAESEDYQPERVRVIVFPDPFIDPAFSDEREWPLDESWDQWQELPNGSTCRMVDAEALDVFTDATQATTWQIPEGSGFSGPVQLLVRPLHPGEPDCPEV
jgi:hypothetical protein